MGSGSKRRERRKAVKQVCGTFAIFGMFVGSLCMLSYALPGEEGFPSNVISRNTRGRRLKSSSVKPVEVKVPFHNKCIQGFNGDDLGTTHGVLDSPRLSEQQIYPCPQFNTNLEGACCNNVLANEIGMGYDHTFDVGGTGSGTPRTTSCLFKARDKYDELNQYFCFACNPRQVSFTSCCTSEVAGGAPGADKSRGYMTCAAGTETKYGQGNCTAKDVNVIRICKNYAQRAWDKQVNPIDLTEMDPGGLYDECGMLVYVDPTYFPDNAVTPPENPNGILSWGDVDGGNDGDDPVVPSKMWHSFAEFARDIKPPLFDEFAIVIAEDNEDCFNGAYNAVSGLTATSSMMVFTLAVALLLSL